MRVIVAAAVIFCAFQIAAGVSNLDTLRAGITRQKTTVQSTLSRVQRHKKDFSFNLGNKLSNAKLDSMQQINSIVNPTLTNIEDATKKSTAEGKDASNCYESARLSLRDYSMKGFSDLEECKTAVLSSVSQVQDNIDSTIVAGQQVITYLDSIFPSCFTTSIQQMELCIVGKLPAGTQLVQTFQSTADSVISSSNSAASQAYIDAVNCNRGPVSNVREGATNAQIGANQCIAAL